MDYDERLSMLTIKEHREHAGKTRSEAAEYAGIKYAKLTRYENFEFMPPEEVRYTLCNLYGIDHADVRWFPTWIIQKFPPGTEIPFEDGAPLQRPAGFNQTDRGRTYSVDDDGKVLW